MLRDARLLALLALAPALACQPRGNNGDDDDDLTGVDDDDSVADDDDATTPPPPETACEDGEDNDLDGLTDCADDDCAAVWRCTWPVALDHSGRFDYDASWQAELGGYSDCTTQFTAALEEESDPDKQCPSCDRTFSGPMTYTQDTCPAGAEPRPDAVAYGVVFVTTIQREIVSFDGVSSWNSVGFANAPSEGQPFVLSRTDGFEVEGVDAGDITTTLSFTDPL